MIIQEIQYPFFICYDLAKVFDVGYTKLSLEGQDQFSLMVDGPYYPSLQVQCTIKQCHSLQGARLREPSNNPEVVNQNGQVHIGTW